MIKTEINLTTDLRSFPWRHIVFVRGVTIGIASCNERANIARVNNMS